MESSKHEINGQEISHYLPVPFWLTLTKQHMERIQEFRVLVQDLLKPEHSDFYLSRFLVARKWSLQHSVEMFKQAMTQRAEEDVDHILEKHPSSYWFDFLSSYWPTSVQANRSHLTKDGCPVMYESIGRVHPHLAELIPLATLARHHVYNFELLEKQQREVEEKNGFSTGVIWIEDLQHLELQHCVGKRLVNLVQTVCSRDEIGYPESIRKIYIVNAPTVFNLVWSMVLPFLEEATKAKFNFGSSKDFHDEWDDIIGMENVPRFLGGKLEWDPPIGGPIKPLIPDEMKTVNIKRRDAHFFEVFVEKERTLVLEFFCEKGERYWLWLV